MRILLVYPELPDTFWSFKYALPFVRKKSAFPPLGLLTVAAMLPSEWEKRLADLNVTRLSDEEIRWADYVFVSGMALQLDSARRVIARCKAQGVKVVAGGPIFTTEREHFRDVDHLVLNEAEATLPAFLADLREGKAGREYSTTVLPDIRESPVPLWELADMRQYASMSIQFSRGCPYHCEFCNVTSLFGHRPRTKAAPQIIAELDGLYEQGWRGAIFFVDDNFIGNKRALRNELLPAIIDWRKNHSRICFHTEVSINLADDAALMEMMRAAGFDKVFVGIETPDEESLRECSKKQNVNRDLVEDVKRIQRAGMEVQGGFIVGFDNDKPSIFRRQIDFIQRSGIVMAMVGMLQAPSGTRLYERLKREGRLLGRMSGDNVDGTTNIIPAMNAEVLREGYRSILQHIYSPDHYYRRVRTLLREYRPLNERNRLQWWQVRAFVRSVLHLGIRGEERWNYWRLLGWTLLHRPRMVPLAVTFAIYGHHFRRICELRMFS